MGLECERNLIVGTDDTVGGSPPSELWAELQRCAVGLNLAYRYFEISFRPLGSFVRVAFKAANVLSVIVPMFNAIGIHSVGVPSAPPTLHFLANELYRALLIPTSAHASSSTSQGRNIRPTPDVTFEWFWKNNYLLMKKGEWSEATRSAVENVIKNHVSRFLVR